MPSDTLTFKLFGQDVSASKAMQKVGETSSKVGNTIKTKLAAGAAAGGAALVAGFSGMIERSQLDAKLGVQLGLAKDEASRFGKLSGQIYSDNFGEDLGQVNDAIVQVYRNIGEGNDQWTQDITKQVLTVAQVFDQDLGGTTRAVGQLLRTGLAQSADEALDIITVGFQRGVDKSGDFLETLNEYGTLFRNMGIDAETAVGLMSQGLQAGARDADKVADAIKEFSIRAVDGSKLTAEGFADLGLKVRDVESEIGKGNGSAVLGDVIDRLNRIEDPAKRAQVAVKLFGTQAEDLGDALYALQTGDAAASLGQVAGAAREATEAMGDTPAAKIEKFKRVLTQGFTGAAGALAGFATANSAWLLPLVGTLATIAGAILAVNAATRAWAATQAAITAVTEAWKVAQLALNASFLANPIVLAIAAVVALVAAIVIAYKKSETFRSIVQAAWSGIQAVISTVVGWVTTNVPKMWQAVVSAWSAVGNAIGNVISWFASLPGKIGAAIQAIPQLVKTMAQNAAFALGYGIGLMVKAVISLPGIIWGAISSAAQLFGKGVAAIIAFAISLPGKIIAGIRALPGLVWNVFLAMNVKVAQALTSMKSKAVSLMTSVASTLASWASTAVSRTVAFFTQLPGRAYSAISSLPGKIRSVASGAGSWLLRAGKDAVMGLVRGINAAAGGAIGAIRNLAGRVIAGFKSAMGIGSPSRVFRESGGNIGEGLLLGLEDRKQAIQRAVDGLVALPSVALGAVREAGPRPLSPLVAGAVPAQRAGGDLHVHVEVGQLVAGSEQQVARWITKTVQDAVESGTIRWRRL